jgi:hypothetical protein
MLIASTALLTLPAFAQAQSSGSEILNGQTDFHLSLSNLNVQVGDISGNVSAQSVAAGNTLDVTTMDDTSVTNEQYASSAMIGSTINADVQNIGGTVSLVSQAVCNSATISTDPNVTAVYSNQECQAIDPASSLNANVANIGNDVSLASMAVGNTFEEDTNAASMPVQTYQINASSINSSVNTKINNVTGNVDVTSAAIGNSAQIIHY